MRLINIEKRVPLKVLTTLGIVFCSLGFVCAVAPEISIPKKGEPVENTYSVGYYVLNRGDQEIRKCTDLAHHSSCLAYETGSLKEKIFLTKSGNIRYRYRYTPSSIKIGDKEYSSYQSTPLRKFMVKSECKVTPDTREIITDGFSHSFTKLLYKALMGVGGTNYGVGAGPQSSRGFNRVSIRREHEIMYEFKKSFARNDPNEEWHRFEFSEYLFPRRHEFNNLNDGAVILSTHKVNAKNTQVSLQKFSYRQSHLLGCFILDDMLNKEEKHRVSFAPFVILKIKRASASPKVAATTAALPDQCEHDLYITPLSLKEKDTALDWCIFQYGHYADSLEGDPFAEHATFERGIAAPNLKVITQTQGKHGNPEIFESSFNPSDEAKRRKRIGEVDFNSRSYSTMTHGRALSEFLSFGFNKYAPKRKLLMFNGHGDGVSTCYNEQEQKSLDIYKISWALGRQNKGTKKVDIAYLDSCLLGNLETVNQLRKVADYIIVSQDVFYTNSVMLNSIAHTLSSHPSLLTKDITGLWKSAIEDQRGKKADRYTLSCIDSSKVKGLRAEFDKLCDALTKALISNPKKVRLREAILDAISTSLKFDKDDPYNHIDLQSFLTKLKDNNMLRTLNISEHYNKVLTHVKKAVIWNTYGERYTEKTGENPCGLSICFGMVFPDKSDKSFADSYEGLSLYNIHDKRGEAIDSTSWGKFLRQLRASIEPTVKTLIPQKSY